MILTTIDVFKRYENAVWSLRGWVSHVSSVGTKKRSVMWKRKSHFMNSVLSTPGTYSCALNSFLEISSHLFLPYLSTLTARNEFTELKRYENAVWSLRGWVSHVSSVGTKKRSVMWKRKSHFMNSVLSTPGTYSCALNSFLEISSHLFLPYLSTLTARNEFTELLCKIHWVTRKWQIVERTKGTALGIFTTTLPLVFVKRL